MTTLLLSLLAIVPREDIAREKCDLIELNGLYDEQGRLVFDQIIFYDFCRERSRYQVRAWRLVKDHNQLPTYDHTTGLWQCRWLDGEVTRCVTADSYRRTWTQYDPELAEREFYPKERRKELIKGWADPYKPPFAGN